MLVCCMEVVNVVCFLDFVVYVFYFFVYQDGFCNGLQYYVVLGCDSVGVVFVNLEFLDVLQDVYSGVVVQVEVFCRQDVQWGMWVVQMLEGFIICKVVKQMVMIVVYGVIYYGGCLQIEKCFWELIDFFQEFVWEVFYYFVCQVFKSLQEMFLGIWVIQYWLIESVCFIFYMGFVVEWVIFLGIFIIQFYCLDFKVK